MSELLNLVVNHPVRIAVLGVLIVAGAACSKPDEVPPVGTAVTAEAEELGRQARASYLGQGAPKDYNEALRLARLAAQKGHPGSMVLIGTMYAQGDGVEKNQNTAFRWLVRADERGSAESMLMLGAIYQDTGSLPTARDYFVRAEKIKPGSAKSLLASLERLEEDVARQRAEASRKLALESGNALEVSLLLGISTKTQYQRFTNAGGLDHVSEWRGFKVNGVGTVYNTARGHAPGDAVNVSDPATLSGFSLVLFKSFPDHRLASIDNLTQALRSECGTWSSSDQVSSNQWMRQHANNTCLIAEEGLGVRVGVMPK